MTDLAKTMVSGRDTPSCKPLATTVQRDAERVSLRIVASEAVRSAMGRVREELLHDPVAATADGAAGLDRAVELWALSLALRETVGDPARPAFVWPIDDTPRHWFGHDFPGASVGGVANPDNIYRNAFIDGVRRYEVRGYRNPTGPATFSLELARQTPGELLLAPPDGKLGADLGDQLGILTQRELQISADGGFQITLGPEPTAGRSNHLQTPPGFLALNHRDTLADWRQVPNALEIRVLTGQADAPLTEAQLIKNTAEHLPGFVRFWTPFRRTFLGAPPPNTVSTVFPRDGGWGFAAGGRYALAPDEALLIVTRSGGAAYTGFQITDPWMMVPDMRAHQGSLNNSQVTPDSDGTLTYVICRNDPGIANWIDTAGHAEGWFMLRWQDLSENTAAADLVVRDARIVKRSELDRVLGSNVARLSPSERRARLDGRAIDYARRLGQ
jgi:hypothetical protein